VAYSGLSVKKALSGIAKIMEQNKMLLIELDAALGDGDLGIYMESGFEKISADMSEPEAAPGTILNKAGQIMMEEVPSTLGTLLGAAMRRMGKSLGQTDAFSIQDFVTAWEMACDEIQSRGKAKLGDKTILDTVYPASNAMQEALSVNMAAGEVLQKGYDAALKALEASNRFQAVHGRAGYFGEKSIGMQDGGATVGVLILEGICKAYNLI
jgi:dihydroxyacetone kinase-like protein